MADQAQKCEMGNERSESEQMHWAEFDEAWIKADLKKNAKQDTEFEDAWVDAEKDAKIAKQDTEFEDAWVDADFRKDAKIAKLLKEKENLKKEIISLYKQLIAKFNRLDEEMEEEDRKEKD